MAWFLLIQSESCLPYYWRQRLLPCRLSLKRPVLSTVKVRTPPVACVSAGFGTLFSQAWSLNSASAQSHLSENNSLISLELSLLSLFIAFISFIICISINMPSIDAIKTIPETAIKIITWGLSTNLSSKLSTSFTIFFQWNWLFSLDYPQQSWTLCLYFCGCVMVTP